MVGARRPLRGGGEVNGEAVGVRGIRVIFRVKM